MTDRDHLRGIGMAILLWLFTGGAHADPTAVAAELQRLLATTATIPSVDGVELQSASVLRPLYAARGYRPGWTESHRKALVGAVVDSFHDGLDPADYPTPNRALDASLAPDVQARQDLVLTESLVRLAYSLRFGKANPRLLDADWNYPRALGSLDPGRWLQEALAGDLVAALATLRPQSPYYQALRSALADYRQRLHRQPWPHVPEGPSLKPGSSDPRVAMLRARLVASGDLATDAPAAADPASFDDALERAVRAFQSRHGLASDGTVGPATLAALNVPLAARIETLRVNLERIRWVFHDLGREFLAVNIAAFHAALVVDGAIAWQSRVVVGRPYRQTPLFRSEIRTIELNPTWTVPPTILAEDILPAQRRDRGTLTRKKLQVLDRAGRVVDPDTIDWAHATARRFPYVLRQPAGPDNALGRIKFLFPNPHAVYLHDTPARELFALPARSFSSGCIRVEQPFTLAERLLAGDPRGTPESLAASIATGTTARITLARPMPIMLLYLTAFPGPDGTLEFRPDVYTRDAAVSTALAAPWRFSAPTDFPGGAQSP